MLRVSSRAANQGTFQQTDSNSTSKFEQEIRVVFLSVFETPPFKIGPRDLKIGRWGSFWMDLVLYVIEMDIT